MSNMYPGFSNSYSEQDLKRIQEQKKEQQLIANVNNSTQLNLTETIINKYEVANSLNITTQSVNNCECKPIPVWPLQYNPPAPPAVMPRPYPPEFLPAHPDVAIITVDCNHTSAFVHNKDSHEPIYHYILTDVRKDINEACYITLSAANMYTEEYTTNCFNYYDQDRNDKTYKIVRYRGRAVSGLNLLFSELIRRTQNFAQYIILSTFYKNNPEFSIFEDLRVGDLFTTSASSIFTSESTELVDEYICIQAGPSAKFEKVGSNNIDIIESAITGAILSAKIYTDDCCSTTLTTSKNYTDKRINDLGKVFNHKGYIVKSSILTGNYDTKEYRQMTPYDFISTLWTSPDILSKNNAENLAKSLRQGDIFLTDEPQPLSCIAQYLYISSGNIQSAIKSQNWQKLGSNSGYALSADVSALVATTAIQLSTYIQETSSLLEQSAAASTEWALSASKIYTNNVSAEFAKLLSGDFNGVMVYQGHACHDDECSGLYPWQVYSNEGSHHHSTCSVFSGHVYETDVELSGTDANGNIKVIDTVKEQFIYINGPASAKTSYKQISYTTQLNDYSTVAYVQNIANQLNNYIIVSSQIAAASAFNTAKEYTDNVSSKFQKKLSGLIFENTSGTMMYKGYVHPEGDKTQKPWIHFAHWTILSGIYQGAVYIVNEEINSSIITAQYMFIGNNQSELSSQAYWLKLGYPTDLNNYATINYVNSASSYAYDQSKYYTDILESKAVISTIMASANAYSLASAALEEFKTGDFLTIANKVNNNILALTNYTSANAISNKFNANDNNINKITTCLDGIINNPNTTLSTVVAYIDDKKYLPAIEFSAVSGTFLTEHQSLSAYYNKTEIDSKFNNTNNLIQTTSANITGLIGNKSDMTENTVYGYFNYKIGLSGDTGSIITHQTVYSFFNDKIADVSGKIVALIPDLNNYYTKTEIDTKFDNYYTKDTVYTKDEVNAITATLKNDLTQQFNAKFDEIWTVLTSNTAIYQTNLQNIKNKLDNM